MTIALGVDVCPKLNTIEHWHNDCPHHHVPEELNSVTMLTATVFVHAHKSMSIEQFLGNSELKSSVPNLSRRLHGMSDVFQFTDK